tara:strand:- start:160 stop:402 length:243 start_codon:yes stop_codon:yes gene_type:complete
MNTTELKNTREELVGWVQSLTDDSLLTLLNSVRLSSEGKTSDWWEELTEKDRQNILTGITDYEQGATMTSDKFWNDLTNG